MTKGNKTKLVTGIGILNVLCLLSLWGCSGGKVQTAVLLGKWHTIKTSDVIRMSGTLRRTGHDIDVNPLASHKLTLHFKTTEQLEILVDGVSIDTYPVAFKTKKRTHEVTLPVTLRTKNIVPVAGVVPDKTSITNEAYFEITRADGSMTAIGIQINRSDRLVVDVTELLGSILPANLPPIHYLEK